MQFTEGTDGKEGTKGPEKVDDILQSLFRSLDRQKSKDDRKSVERKVIIDFQLFFFTFDKTIDLNERLFNF